jgi:ubiquitin C-terminal hydrolase
MNSMLQTLFHLPNFRKIVYSINTYSETSDNASVALALQRVFWLLQTGEKAVSTKQLTAAFGWKGVESFIQHDVQEFCRVLLDNVDEKMKKTLKLNEETAQDGSKPASSSTDMSSSLVAKLFEGSMENYIECINVPYKSTRLETFLDLQMNVKGCGSLDKSFEQYIEVETLDKKNQYRAEGFGLQDAKKGIRFKSFPPLLQLQLKRFEFNFMTEQNTKLNERFEFPSLLDLSKYLQHSEEKEANEQQQTAVYALHSVLVHAGSVGGGHYYCYERPLRRRVAEELKISALDFYLNSPWYKFDDETVSKVKSEEAIEGNFGGNKLSTANAYMLVYISTTVLEQELTQAIEEQKQDDNPAIESNGASQKPSDSAVETATENNNDIDDNAKEATAATPSPKVNPNLASIIDVSIPGQLTERFQAEIAEQNAILAQKARAHLYTDINVFSDLNWQTEVPVKGTSTREIDVLQQERSKLFNELAAQLSQEGNTLDEILNLIVDYSLKSESSQRAGHEMTSSFLQSKEHSVIYEYAPQSLHVEKASSVMANAVEIAKITNIPAEDQQYWHISQRNNHTSRPNSYCNKSTNRAIGEEINYSVFVRSTRDDYDEELFQFTQQAGVSFTSQSVDPRNFDRVLLLFKYFDIMEQKLVYLGSAIFYRSASVSAVTNYVKALLKRKKLLSLEQVQNIRSLAKQLIELERSTENQEKGEEKQQDDIPRSLHPDSVEGGFAGNAEYNLVCWEEEKAMRDAVTPILNNQTIQDTRCGHGDILVFQLDYSQAEHKVIRAFHEEKYNRYVQLLRNDLHRQIVNSQSATPVQSDVDFPFPLCHRYFPAVPNIMKYLVNHHSIQFRSYSWANPSKDNPNPPNNRTITLELDDSCDYTTIRQLLANIIDADPNKLQLFKHNQYHKTVDHAVDQYCSPQQAAILTLDDMIKFSEPILYFQQTHFTTEELQKNFHCKVVYADSHLDYKYLSFLAPKGMTFQELQQLVVNQLYGEDSEKAKNLPSARHVLFYNNYPTWRCKNFNLAESISAWKNYSTINNNSSDQPLLIEEIAPYEQPIQDDYKRRRDELRRSQGSLAHSYIDDDENEPSIRWMFRFIPLKGQNYKMYGVPFTMIFLVGESLEEFMPRFYARIGYNPNNMPAENEERAKAFMLARLTTSAFMPLAANIKTPEPAVKAETNDDGAVNKSSAEAVSSENNPSASSNVPTAPNINNPLMRQPYHLMCRNDSLSLGVYDIEHVKHYERITGINLLGDPTQTNVTSLSGSNRNNIFSLFGRQEAIKIYNNN